MPVNNSETVLDAILGDIYTQLEMSRGEAIVHLQTNDLKRFDEAVNKLLQVSKYLEIDTKKYL